jgi:hypothetical protein
MSAAGARGGDKNIKNIVVRFQVLTAASMKMAVFWIVSRCNLVDV